MAYNNKGTKYQFGDKWPSDIEQYNFTQVPNLLLSCQGHLKLTDGELLTLIHLLTFWYHSGSRVFPSITKLRMFSHKSYPTIQKRLKRLEDKEFIRRVHRLGTSNTYDLLPCVGKLQKHAFECDSMHKKDSYWGLLYEVYPSSKTINKEDEDITIQSKKTENIQGFQIEAIQKFLEIGK